MSETTSARKPVYSRTAQYLHWAVAAMIVLQFVLIEIAEGMTLDPARMNRNLDLTGGMILSEAIMMELGETMGRQVAHDLVYDAVEKVREGSSTFADALTNDPQIREQLGNDGTDRLTNPSVYTGLCSDMARAQAAVARNVATELKALTA